MCQHSQGESDWLMYVEKQQELREIEKDGFQAFKAGVPIDKHLHYDSVRKDASPGKFYSAEWFKKDTYYGERIKRWEKGWIEAEREKNHD